jgi:hypothetical protein
MKYVTSEGLFDGRCISVVFLYRFLLYLTLFVVCYAGYCCVWIDDYLLSDPGLQYLYYACRGGMEFPAFYLMSGSVTLGCPLFV